MITLVAMLTSSFTPQSHRLLDSRYKHVFVADGVITSATAARKVFDDRFANPRSATADRFAWDPWHVTQREEDMPTPPTAAAGSVDGGYGASANPAAGFGQQYTFLRTPAAQFFEPKLFEQLCAEITEYGQHQLGCNAITPPWLALYTDGCSQNFHTDAPHGPFAFVLSLTPQGAHGHTDGSTPGWFEGGETTLLQPWVCDYWRSYDSGRGLEFPSLFEQIAPSWNRLICFDSRLPHGEGQRLNPMNGWVVSRVQPRATSRGAARGL